MILTQCSTQPPPPSPIDPTRSHRGGLAWWIVARSFRGDHTLLDDDVAVQRPFSGGDHAESLPGAFVKGETLHLLDGDVPRFGAVEESLVLVPDRGRLAR